MRNKISPSQLLELPDNFYQKIKTSPISNPYLVDFNKKLAEDFELEMSQELIELVSGNKPATSLNSIATVYAGHQFGGFVPQLGDGRAILLGEIQDKSGKSWEVQLKGAGETAFSRQGDGRAVLRSTIREYLCSEAMHHLNIPTTRALCITGSRDPVYRENVESTAVLTRMAPSHIRFGHFEYFYHSEQTEMLGKLVDFVIQHYFPEAHNSTNKYETFLQQVIISTAELVAKWQCVGFSHGVMNTDNMSIMGLTIDYGPFGFLDEYDPDYICNHSDYQGRYAFNKQGEIAFWNLHCLAQCFTSFLSIDALRALLAEFQPAFSRAYTDEMHKKLGLKSANKETQQSIQQFLELLAKYQLDYTNSFRNLTENDYSDNNEMADWFVQYKNLLNHHGYAQDEIANVMNSANPKYILRNHLAQTAIEKAENGDFSEVQKLRKLLNNPYDEQPDMAAYAAVAPDWAKALSISCSS